MSRVFSLRTKLEVAGTICLLISLSLVSVFAVTRTISDTGDTVDTYIRNSNGNYWTATAANLQTAIWDLNSSHGGAVYLPVCNITLNTGTINLISDLTLSGVGNASLIFQGPNNYNRTITMDDCHHVLIENIRFDFFNYTKKTPPVGSDQTANISIIWMEGFCSFITISHCSFYNGHGSIIDSKAIEPTNNMTVDICDFHKRERRYYGSAIRLEGSDCTVRNCFIEDTYASGVGISGTTYYIPYPQRNIIDGNTITGEISGGIVMEDGLSTKCIVTNNHIHHINSTAYWATTSSYSSGITLSDNNTCSDNIIEYFYGIGIGSSGNNAIENNRISEIEKTGGIQGSSGDSIIGNHIYTSKFDKQPDFGIKASNSQIIANIIIGANPTTNYDQGIFIQKKCTVSSNNITGAADGIRVDSGAAYSTITSNIFNKISTEAILINGASFCTIGFNTIISVYGIKLVSAHNNTVIGNIVTATVGGSISAIYENTVPANYNIIMGNNLMGSTNHTVTLIGGKSTKIYNMGDDIPT